MLSVLKGEPGGSRSGLVDQGSFWQDVLDKTVREGVFYPFYKKLLLLDTQNIEISHGIRERYRQTYYLHAAKSSVFMLQVSRILARLESCGIDVLLFKGPAIDSYIYDDFLRPRLDLDIAVKDADVPGLERALCDSGYTAPPDPGKYPLPEYLNSRLFMPLVDELVPVHVHRHLVNNMFLTVDNMLSIDMETVWEQTVLFKDYRHIYVLKPEMNIVFLCEHGLKHDFDQMVYLYEIGQMVRFYGSMLDWQKLLVVARESGLGRAAYYGLYFVNEFFSGDVPGEIINALKPRILSGGEKKFIRNTLVFKRSRYASYPVYVSMRPGLWKKTYFMLRTLFPPEMGLKGYLVRVYRALKGLANPLIL
jgi:hypothetical protein